MFISADKAKEFRRSVARRGDLVFTCWGTIGQVGLVDERSRFAEYVVSNKRMKLTPDPQKADSVYLYYLFSAADTRCEILDRGIGSFVPGFNLGQLRSLRLRIPPLAEQRLGLADGVGTSQTTLGAFLERFFEAMTAKVSTRTFYGHTRRCLEE